MEKVERELAKLIAHLKGMRGSGTELISVYIPSGYPVADVSNKLKGEYGQAANIKSKTTRLNVQSALEKIIQYLKVFRETPTNGVAIFCGNISKVPGKTDIELFSISPPQPVNVQIYRCDSTFLLEPLELLGGRKEKYGLVAIDGTETTIAVLQGNVHKITRYIPYLGPSKTHKGGSCIHEDAKVHIEDKGLVPIKEVKEGDKVKCIDLKRKGVVFSSCEAVMKRMSEEAFDILIENGESILATAEHRFFVQIDEELIEKYVDELEKGDVLLSSSGPKRIEKINRVKAKGHFYDLSVPGLENFLANDILVHNSAARYDRTLLEAKDAYYKKVGEEMDKTLFASGIDKVIVGGPGPVKDIFLKMKPFNYQFKILGVIDTGYSDEYGILELKERSVHVIAEEKSLEEKAIIDRFMKEVVKEGLATYGVKEVTEALETGKVETLLLSEKLELKHAKMRCSQGHESEVFREEGRDYRCSQDGNVLGVVEEKDLFDELYDMADAKGIEVKVISADTRDGAQFLAGFKGVGALLRFK